MIKFDDVKKNTEVKTYIAKADESLIALGYTEHSFAHVLKVATTAKYILTTLGYSQKEIELAQIACYLHDIGILSTGKTMRKAVLCWIQNFKRYERNTR